MELTKEQNEKLNVKMLNFIDELLKLIDIYGINKIIEINCIDYFNDDGGLKIVFTDNKYIYYKTSKSYLIEIYNEPSSRSSIYKRIKLYNGNDGLHDDTKIKLDLLKNKETILNTLENELKQSKYIIDDLLK